MSFVTNTHRFKPLLCLTWTQIRRRKCFVFWMKKFAWMSSCVGCTRFRAAASLAKLNNILEKQFSGGSSTKTSKIGGIKVAADIMNFMDTTVEADLMEQIKEVDADLRTEIEDLMFVFDNLRDVDDRGIQVLLQEVSSDVLILALKGRMRRSKRKYSKICPNERQSCCR